MVIVYIFIHGSKRNPARTLKNAHFSRTLHGPLEASRTLLTRGGYSLVKKKTGNFDVFE